MSEQKSARVTAAFEDQLADRMLEMKMQGVWMMRAACNRITTHQIVNLVHNWAVKMLRGQGLSAQHCAGMKQLKMAMARMVNRKLVVQLLIWRSAQQEYDRVLAGQKLGMNIIGATIIRMAKGECTHAVQCWKVNMTEERMNHGSHCAGVKQLKMVMARMVKRQIAVLLIQWRSGQKEYDRVLAGQKLGMNMIGATIIRMAKGECTHAVQCWKVNMTEERMNHGSHCAGVKQLKMVMARMVKGQIAVLLIQWRNALHCHKQIFQAKKHGLAMIGATITRMAKGECAYLFRCWKVNMMDTEARYIQAELEQRMIQDSHSAGLKQLKLVMARMIKGVLGVAVNVWHAAQLQDEQIDTWSNLLQSQSYGSELEGVLASVRQEMEAKEQQLHSLSALQVT